MDDKKEGSLPVWPGENNPTPVLDMGWEPSGWAHEGRRSWYCDTLDEWIDAEDGNWAPNALIDEEESAVGPIRNLYLLVSKEGNPDMKLLLCRGVTRNCCS